MADAHPRSFLAMLRDSKTARQSGLLMGSQGVSMILSFAFTVLITRSLSVADYGMFRYAMTFLAMMMTVMQLGWPYSMARLLALENDRVAQQRIVGAGILLLSVSSVIGMVGTVFVVEAANALGYELPRILLWVAPFLYVTLGQQLVNSICQGLNRITLLATQQVLPYALLLPLTAIQIFLLRSYSLQGAVVNYVIVFSVVIGIGFARAGFSFDDWRSRAVAISRENRRTGFPVYVGGIFGVASAQMIALWVTQFTDSRQYGYYALALAISSPLGVMVSSVGTVIFRTSAGEQSLSRRVLWSAFGFAGLIGLVYWVGTQLFLGRIFGERYEPAVQMAHLLGLGALMIGCGDIFQRFLGAKGQGRRLGMAAVCTGVVGVSSAACLLRPMGVNGAVLSSILASATYLASMIALYVRRPLVARDCEHSRPT